MANLLDSILNDTAPRIISAQHDAQQINFVAGLSDPGEMIRCGYLPELRRHAGESDADYAERIRPLVMALPQAERDVILKAALRRASLDTSNGRVHAAFALKPAWHGLGTVVDGVMTSKEALRLAGLDWQVTKQQLSYTFGGVVKPADSWGIIRQDNGAFLGAVGSRYKPIQNTEGFAFLDGVIGDYGARYESAGSLYNGKSVWMLAHMPKQRFSVSGDEIEPYVLFTNCHDGSGAAYCYPTTVRVECANTFRTSIGDRSKGLSIRHTGNVREKIEQAKEALGLAVAGFKQFKEAAQSLVQKQADVEAYAKSVIDAIFEDTSEERSEPISGVEKELSDAAWANQNSKRRVMLAEIMERYESERCHPKGTAWAAFNAVTEFADHHEQGRQRGDAQTKLSRRFESTLAGERDAIKQVAFTQALAL